MKIVLSLLGKLVNQKGGIEKVCCNMANAMVERGYEVTVLTCDVEKGQPFFPLDEKVEVITVSTGHKESRLWINLRCSLIRNRNKREYERMKASSKLVAYNAQTVIKDIQPNIIIAFDRKSMLVLKDMLDINIPVISMMHFDPVVLLENEYYHQCYAKASCIQVLMESKIDKVKEVLHISNVVCIPNAVYLIEGQMPELKNKIIINVGHIDHNNKRQHFIIEAMAKLKDKYPDWSVQLWGDTSFDKDYYDKLKLLINKYGIQDKIMFCGTTKDIADKLKEASIFAFPTASEGFGLALAEAMSVGLPSVGFSNSAGVCDLLESDENGLLVEETVEAFAEGLDRLMGSMELRVRLGTQAKMDMNIYEPKRIWDMWESLIKSIAYPDIEK